MTLAQLKAYRDELMAALYQGVNEVKAGDKTVIYRSVRQMKDVLSELNNQINELESGTKAVSKVQVYARKGL